MRFLLLVVILTLALCAGCSWKKAGAATYLDTSPNQPSTAPAILLVGKVTQVNRAARFVVLNFPIGHLPMTEQHLHLYRNGQKVGEVKVSSWQDDDNVIADLISGESQVGDEVRDR